MAGTDEQDRAARDAARSIAVRLALDQLRAQRPRPLPRAPAQALPYRLRSDEIDLERTLERLAGKRLPEQSDIVVRERARARRTVVLLVDVSGSMRGERVRLTAATVGALSGALTHDRLAVLAFWSDAAWLQVADEPLSAPELIYRLLSLPARGLTNIAFPLELATDALASFDARGARAVLLSDCVHNAGPDPRPLAAALPRLDVLCDVTTEHDREMARDLAFAGRGRLHLVRGYRDVTPALEAAFAP